MKKKLLYIMVALLPLFAHAYDAEIDGIYYNFSGNVATVTYQGKYNDDYISKGYYSDYSGSVAIPKYVTYSGKTYHVTGIGDYAFLGCSGLTSITIPESVTRIGTSAFFGCSGLDKVIVSDIAAWCGISFGGYDSADGYPMIGYEAANPLYYGRLYSNETTEITDLVIPEGVTSISDYAFEYGNLTSVSIPKSVTSIGNYAFYDCELTSVSIPKSVTSIGNYAFYIHRSLESVFVESITPLKINNNTFSYAENTALYVPVGCKSVYATTDYWGNFKEIIELNQIDGIYYTIDKNKKIAEVSSSPAGFSYNGEIVIPSSITYNGETYNVASIASGAFSGCSDITSIIIPNSVTNIGDYTFRNCGSLSSVIIPNSVKSIGNRAFYGCSGLTSVSIPESVTSIGNYAFYNCGSLTSIIIPNNVTCIGEYSYSCCYNLTSVTISDNISNISSGTFNRCISLNSITIPESVTSIGIGAFSDCISLTSVTIPNSVTSIGGAAFEGTAWFNNQPDGLVYAGKNAYKYKGKMPEGTEISIKEGTLGISAGSFWNCSGLTSVTIPESIMNIGDHAFSDCRGLKDVYSYAENVPSTGSYAYYSSPISSATLHVPAVSVDSYRSTSPWKEFGMIISIGETTPNIVFADVSIKAICVANWDANGDGELSEAEAASVASLEEVFRGNNSITSFNELQYFTRLTSIGDNAFCLCRKLTSITMPNNIASIGNGSFRNCGSLTSVTIPNSVTSIGERAFSNL